MGLIDRRDTDEITVTVRHRCPEFCFGSALGPGNLATWWWVNPRGVMEILPDPGGSRRSWGLIHEAIMAELRGLADLRRHLDELAERPDVPQ